MSKEFKSFTASAVPLEHTNLIEASAGTGKTYSIAILTLRLILEKGIGVQEILMVTFTKAAVAELEERVRLFVRLAMQAAEGREIKDKTIAELVRRAADSESLPVIAARLKDAMLFLDETSVLTIHSFCQLTLTEFSFETGQMFGAEIMQDGSRLINSEVNAFWRREVTTLPLDVLRLLLKDKFGRTQVSQVIREYAAGKTLRGYSPGLSYDLKTELPRLAGEMSALEKQIAEMMDDLYQYCERNTDEIRRKVESNTYARKAFSGLTGRWEDFVKAVTDKKGTGYIKTLFEDILEAVEEAEKLRERLDGLRLDMHSLVGYRAIKQISSALMQEKKRENKISFDDLIQNLHDALVKRDNPVLIAALRQKYKAVFIDEFQDTDRLQYEVFETAFGEETIMFYIGDPKQSIYAWRKADIHTYFKASAAVARRYSMNTNFRSSRPMIAAMNQFFLPCEGFDTFSFRGEADRIDYISVESPENNSKGVLMYHGREAKAISVASAKNKAELNQTAAAQIVTLLSDPGYRISSASGERAVRLSDIGILVRTNSQSREIKRQLDRHRIPSVSINDARILSSEEAPQILYLLEAIIENTRSNINRALLSPLTGLGSAEILGLDESVLLDRFQNYQQIMDRSGIYAALTSFGRDFSIQRQLLTSGTASAERVLTNFYQLVELLHKVQSFKKFSATELISWLQRSIQGLENEGDEFEQRVESDEEAIRIVTIHKSKGLEYNIVIAPFLDFQSKNDHELLSYRDAESGEYLVAQQKLLDADKKDEIFNQLEQENRRLLYVAITRAVYKCFIVKNESSKNKDSTLQAFLCEFGPQHDQIEFQQPEEADETFIFKKQQEARPAVEASAPDFSLLAPNWRKMSYSMLSNAHGVFSYPSAMHQEDAYDQFIFRELSRGAKTGNLLHYIFENIRFNSDTGWTRVVEDALRKHAPGQADRFGEHLLMLLEHALNCRLGPAGEGFCLADVPHDKQLHELEFDFSVPGFDARGLESFSDERRLIHVGDYSEMEGIMNGKIDLFFKAGEKYYVLDWKSNYLGDKLADYSTERVQQAMNDNNYHLQYLIYTLAVKKYLRSRVPGFDYDRDFGGVIYLFLRGVRRAGGSGIFQSKPTRQDVEGLEQLLCGGTT